MSPRCSEPDLQTALLNEAHEVDGRAPDLALHLENCEACRIATERLRRVASVWAEDHADEAAIALAAAKFQGRRAAARSTVGWFDIVPFASAGVAAGCALLVATGTVRAPWSSRRATEALPQATKATSTVAVPSGGIDNGAAHPLPDFADTEENAKRVRARAHIETARGVAPLVNGLRLELKRGESARVTLTEGHAANVEGPCLVEFWSTPMEASGWRMVREETADAPSIAVEQNAVVEAREAAGASSAAGASPSAAVPTGSNSFRSRALAEGVATARDLAGPGSNPTSAPAWARAAAALRQDDFDAADRAFSELGQSSDPATRDAARLARAQLWISRGREAAVRPVLEQLAQSGATALVRQRAAEFLNRDSR